MSGIVLCAPDIGRPRRDQPVLSRAGQIAALDAAQLCPLTVVSDPVSSTMAGALGRDVQDRTIEQAQRALTGLAGVTLGADDRLRHILATGNVAETDPARGRGGWRPCHRHRRAEAGFPGLSVGSERRTGGAAFQLLGFCGSGKLSLPVGRIGLLPGCDRMALIVRARCVDRSRPDDHP